MVALKANEVDAFVARPDPARPVVLAFGPDAGLVRERAETIARGAVDDPADPFALVRLDGDELAADPLRLLDEANTVPLFGGKRALWVRAGTRNMTPALEALLGGPKPECRVVVEAGDLKRGAPLRNLCERSPYAVALPCYADAERDLARLIDAEMQAAGLSLAPDARAALVPLLGGDRLASRSEIAKLVLYAGNTTRIELDDVLAVIADASSLALETIFDAAFAGQPAEVEAAFEKARIAGTHPGRIVSLALHHAMRLHRARLTVDAGRTASAAVDAMTPPVHFRRRALIERAVATWSSERLQHVVQQLADAALAVRKDAALGEAIAHRVLLQIAVNARTRR